MVLKNVEKYVMKVVLLKLFINHMKIVNKNIVVEHVKQKMELKKTNVIFLVNHFVIQLLLKKRKLFMMKMVVLERDVVV